MNKERRDRLIESVFQVRPNELRLTSLLFLHCLCNVGAFVVGRSVRDSLYLAHGARANLPMMYVASALAVTVVGLGYARIADRFKRDALTAVFASIFGLGFSVARALLPTTHEWLYSALYVYVEVVGALTVIQFWTLANDIFHARDAKRLFGTIGAGGTVASIVFGSAVGSLAKRVGTENLLYVSAFLLIVVALLAKQVGKRIPVRMSGRGRNLPSQRSGASRIFASGHLKSVAALAGATFVATTFVDFEFKVIASQSFDKDGLTAFFGNFYAVTGLLSLVTQFFGTARLLSAFGIVTALGLLPLFLGFGSVAVFLTPGLIAATFTKGSENVLRYTVNDATTQLLYLPVPANVRGSAKAFIDGAIKPAAIAFSGLALMAYGTFMGKSPGPVGLASAAACVVWGLVVFQLRGQYLRSLQDTLRTRRIDLDGSARSRIADGATAKVLAKALESQEPKEVLNALELLPHLQNLDVEAQVEHLLQHASADVRMAALAHLARKGSLHLGNAVFRMFDDPDSRVRAAAIDAFCSIGRDKAVRSVKGFLKDPEPAIRAAAIVGMIRYGGLDGVLAAAEALKALIGDADPVMREHAAKVLGAIGVKNFYQPVLELMSDKDFKVRRAAIAAAGELKAPELTTALIYRLAREETASDAAEALAHYGPGIEATLARVIDNRLEDPMIRRSIPRVLGRLATPQAIDVLTTHLADPDEAVRASIYRALSRALRHKRGLAFDRKVLGKAVDYELSRAYHALACAEALKLGAPPGPYTPRTGQAAAEALLASALIEKVEQCEARIFTLLGVLYPDAEVGLIYAGYRDASAQDAARRRANAVELLDNLLDRQLKPKLLPLLEDGPRDVKLRAVEELFPTTVKEAVVALAQLLVDETAWVRACAVHLAGEMRATTLSRPVRENLDHGWPVVREAAVVSLEKTLDLADLARAVEKRARDEADFVRSRARAILAADEAARATTVRAS